MSSKWRRGMTLRERRVEDEKDECYRQRARQLRQEAADREELLRNAELRERERREAASAARTNKDALKGAVR